MTHRAPNHQIPISVALLLKYRKFVSQLGHCLRTRYRYSQKYQKLRERKCIEKDVFLAVELMT